MERFRTSRIGAELKAAPQIQLLPAGNFRSTNLSPLGAGAWKIDATNAAKVIAAARARANPTVIDYENQTVHSEVNGLPAPAAGWFRALEWREGKGLYAVDVEWTARAKRMIEAGEYRHVSPVFRYNPASRELLEVLTVGLTNTPRIEGMDDLTERAAARFEGGDLVAAAKAEFESSAALREEFVDLRTYIAWRKADAQGKVKSFGRSAR